MDGRAAHRAAWGYLRVAGLSRLFFGLAFTAAGGLGGLLVGSVTGSLAIGGGVAAAGVVAGFLSSRRGFKVLRAPPLRVDGVVQRKATEAQGKRTRYLVAVDVSAVWTLFADGQQSQTTQAAGPRTLTASAAVYDRLEPGASVGLVCLPTGMAIALASDFPEA
ncbi:MAG: hypothetical protein R3F60_14500 [bacterium]